MLSEKKICSCYIYYKPLVDNDVPGYFVFLCYCIVHYENTSMQHTAIFHSCKMTIFDYFHIFAHNIDCGYSLELPQ